jgi:hypothetical protein
MWERFKRVPQRFISSQFSRTARLMKSYRVHLPSVFLTVLHMHAFETQFGPRRASNHDYLLATRARTVLCCTHILRDDPPDSKLSYSNLDFCTTVVRPSSGFHHAPAVKGFKRSPNSLRTGEIVTASNTTFNK